LLARNLTVLKPFQAQLIVGIRNMKRTLKRGLGEAIATATLLATSILSGYQLARADEAPVSVAQEIVIFDGPGLLETPNDPVPAIPPRESPVEPQTPAQQDPPPVTTPTPDSSPKPSDASPSQDIIETFGAETTTATDAPVLVSKPLVILIPAKSITLLMAPGSTLITADLKASLAKTASAVKATNRPVSISIKTAGTTLSKATAQANAIVAELKRRGVSAVTLIKRTGNKTLVSVLVTKTKP
jgi:hypothetical protein